MKKFVVLTSLAALSVAASASTNLLKNGSFEANAQANGTWALVTKPTGWTVVKAGTSTPTGLEIRDNVAGAAEDGKNYIELDGNENDTISQSFATVVGKSYDVSFWFSDRSGVAAKSEGWALKLPGQTDAVKGAGFNNSGGNQWQEFDTAFVATGKLSTLSLTGTGTSDSFGTSIDNVSVTAAVPEPTSLALFAAGLGMMGFAARRRKQ